MRLRFAATLGDRVHMVEVVEADGRFRVTIGEEVWEVDARIPTTGICSLLIGGMSYVADVKEEDGWFLVDVGGGSYRIRVEEETRHIIRTRGGVAAAHRGQVVTAPMPGKIVRVEVEVGQGVKPGDGLLIIEAMKMENEFRATTAGTVREIRVQVGQAVNPGDILIVIE
ncbi:MAG: biotin/lipoyl-binding protein [Candidatus Rokubacteria bacterium]|nr:biotin/lipoyl-binding protein [Candidatus Rokubacteria bacterium]